MLNDYNKNSNCYCPYYNQGLLINSNTEGKTRIAMCCYQERSQPVNKVTFDHPYLESIRKQAFSKIPLECSDECKDDNYFFNERLRAVQQDCWDDSGQKIKKLHLKQGFICNLQCISCSSHLSSAWNTHYHHFDPTIKPMIINKTVEQSWKNLDLSGLSEIHFDGGEPLLNKENVTILEDLARQGILSQVSLSYNTNGTIMPDQRLIDLWAKTRWVRLYISLDGIKSTFEYTRYPAKWHEVERNIFALRKISGPCILLEVNAVVGIHNIFNLKEFYKWWQDNLPTGNQGDPSQIFVRSITSLSYGGKVLDLKHLPTNLKSIAVDYIHELNNLPGSEHLLQDLGSEPNLNWLDYFTKLDSIRDTNWKQSLPKELLKYAQ